MNLKKYNKHIVLLVFLIIFAIVLRVWRLDEVPVSLFGDEIDVGLQAKSILQTGRDYMGNDWPVFFRSFAEYRLPAQLYATVPFIAIFGMNEWGVRLASVVFGIFSIIFFYLMTRKLFNQRIGLVAAFLMTISPWHLQYSRQANDAGFLLPFLFLGTYFLIKGRSNWLHLLISAALFSISFYTYPVSTLFVPLFVIFVMVIYRKDYLKHGYKKLFYVGLATFLLLMPFLKSTIEDQTTHRISFLTSSSDDEIMEELIHNRRWTNSFAARIFYNKHAIRSNSLFETYIEPYSPQFLFLYGDPNPRHSVSGFGMFYHFEIITVLLGIFYLMLIFYKREKKEYILILFAWLILASLPAAVAGDSYHASRLILLMPPVLILSALGLVQIFQFAKTNQGKLIVIIFLLFVVFDINKYFHKYYTIWSNESWKLWHYGFEQTIKEVELIENEFERIYFNNTYEPMLPRFLFWTDYNMKDFQAQFVDDKHVDQVNEHFYGFNLTDKYYFGEIQKPIEPLAKPGVLIVASTDDITNPAIFESQDLELIKTIFSPEDTPIFYIFTGNK